MNENLHVLEGLVLGETSVSGSKPLGANSHLKARDPVAALARKHLHKILGQPPERPEIGLEGATIPSNVIQTEKPDHRFVIFLAAHGKNSEEIAEIVGFSPNYVKTILAQPWARQQVARILEESDPRQMVPQILANAATGSLLTLMEIRDDPKVPAASRIKACDTLLDRFLGKAKESLEIKAKPAESDEEINQRLKELEARQRDLVGRPKLRDVPAVGLRDMNDEGAA